MSSFKVNSKLSAKVSKVSEGCLSNTNKGNDTFFLQFLFQNVCIYLRIERLALSKVGHHNNKYKFRFFWYQLDDQPGPSYVLLIRNCRQQKEH